MKKGSSLSGEEPFLYLCLQTDKILQMKDLLFLSLSFLLLLAGCKGNTECDDMKIDGLTCEYLVDPLSVDEPNPRLAWKIRYLNDSSRGGLQEAYRILVASSLEKLNADEGDLWDSGQVRSGQSVQVVYGGKSLEQVRHCWWKVRIWSNKKEISPWSEPGYWGTGVRNWQAEWIGDRPDLELRKYREYVAKNADNADFDYSYWTNPPSPPSPLLRKTFTLHAPVKRAILYASALGYYEMWMNGKRVGDQLQAPEWTNYADCVQYQTYDVTSLLNGGQNVWAATLADGWALGRLAGIKWMHCFPHRGFYALDRRLFAQLTLEMEDGSVQVVPTDGSWKINPDGYIRMADNFAGETINANKIEEGWNQVGFDDASWEPVYVDADEKRNLTAQRNEPIRVHTELKPVRIWQRGNVTMVDFGQNIAGHCALKIKGKPGQTVTIRHGEWLNDDGSLYTQSLGHAKATDTFILSGKEDYFDPSFTYHGFQYIEVGGLTAPLTSDMITAKAVSSASAVAGTFACSNPDLNQLYRNIVWTQRNNMFSVLHDNPSRDERTGASGDIQIFAQSAIFNMNMAAFLSKFVYDSEDVAENGQFFSMLPSLRQQGVWGGWVGAPGWCEASLIVPWRLYENYADTRILKVLYDKMKHHVDVTWKENPTLIWKVRHNHNGDWLNANTVSPSADTTFCTTRGETPDDVFATAFFAYAARLLSEIADVLQQPDDKAYYGRLAADIKNKFIQEYVDEDGRVEGDTQGAYSLALFYDLIPEGLREKAFGHLVDCIREYDYRLSTGFISTPLMMRLLVDFGRADIAYRLLESVRFPSWLYLVKNGATTVWERWDTWIPGRGFQSAGMNSLDHVAFGSVSEWMFRHILGINPDIEHPGYKHFFIAPVPGGSLTWAEGSYDSLYGKIVSSWRLEDGNLTLDVSVPVNTTATVILPIADVNRLTVSDGQAFRARPDGRIAATVGSGSYRFVMKYEK